MLFPQTLRTRLDNERYRCRIAYNLHAPTANAADVGFAGGRLRSVDVAECYRRVKSKKPAKELVRVKLLQERMGASHSVRTGMPTAYALSSTRRDRVLKFRVVAETFNFRSKKLLLNFESLYFVAYSV